MKKILTIITLWTLTTAPAHAVQLINPIGGSPTDPEGTLDPRVIIGNVIKAILGIIGSVAFIIFIWGGSRMILSLGDYEKVKEGRDAMIWAGVGLIIIFSSYALANFAINAALTGGA